jgi:membrane protease YdiL (CAAX protease family)
MTEPWADSSADELPVARAAARVPLPVAPARPVNPLLPTQSRGDALLDLALVFGVLAFVSLQGVFTPLRLDDEQSELVRTMAPASTATVGLFGVLLLRVLLRRNRQPLESVGLTLRGWPLDVLLGVGCAIGVLALVFVGSALVQIYLPQLVEEMDTSRQNIQEALPPMSPGTILALTLMVALYEEVLFRGFLLTRLRRLLGSWWAAISAGAAMFALLHLYEGALAVLPIVFLSVVLSVMFVWRRSLVAPMVTHFVFNLAMLLMIGELREMGC